MERFLKNLSLKWKVFAFLLAFCAILLLTLWLFQTVLLDAFYRRIKVTEIKSSAGVLAAGTGSDELQSLISGLSQNGVSVNIVTNDGRDILYSGEAVNIFRRMPVREKLNLIDEATAGGGDYIRYMLAPAVIDQGGEGGRVPFVHSIVYARIITLPSGGLGAILMNAQISPVNATVTTLRYQLYLITAIMIALSVLLALLISRRVSKPLVELTGSAQSLAAGNYDVRFEGKGFREIGQLSNTLNTAAAELSKVEGQRRELMANISHDLRTPLALIYSYAEMMHDFPDEVTPDKTQVIMDETRRLTSLVGDIMDLTKLESGIENLNVAEYSLTKSLAETTRRLNALVSKDGYTIDFTSDGEAVVAADETKITQVYYNLLLNAVHYTGADKAVTVRQIIDGGTVRIQVTDTGAGIAPEDQKHIWERYYKIDKTHKRAVTGSGLGLSIVKKVVALHGGDCGVVSDIGRGSTFWFSLKTVGTTAG